MPSAQATFCKKCSYSPPLNRPGRAAAPRRGPRIQALTPPQPPRTRCASHSSRTSPATRLAAATLRPFLPTPRRKPRLRVRSRMHNHDADHRSSQVAPPLLRRLPHARRQHRQAPAGNGAQSTAGRSVLPPKSLVTYISSIRTSRSRYSTPKAFQLYVLYLVLVWYRTIHRVPVPGVPVVLCTHECNVR